MAKKTARCRPALSCLNTHKVARQNATDINNRAPKLIKKPKTPEKKEAMEAQAVNQSTNRSKVTDCARRQLRSSNNIYYRIDWTGLDIPDHICEAVWQFHCMDTLLHD